MKSSKKSPRDTYRALNGSFLCFDDHFHLESQALFDNALQKEKGFPIRLKNIFSQDIAKYRGKLSILPIKIK